MPTMASRVSIGKGNRWKMVKIKGEGIKKLFQQLNSSFAWHICPYSTCMKVSKACGLLGATILFHLQWRIKVIRFVLKCTSIYFLQPLGSVHSYGELWWLSSGVNKWEVRQVGCKAVRKGYWSKISLHTIFFPGLTWPDFGQPGMDSVFPLGNPTCFQPSSLDPLKSEVPRMQQLSWRFYISRPQHLLLFAF